MSCTFWNLRRRKAEIARQQAKAAAVAPAKKEAVKADKPAAKKGGTKNGD